VKALKTTYTCLALFFGLSPFIHAVDEREDFVYDLSLATQGVSVSQYNTGVNYFTGRGIAKDFVKKLKNYKSSSLEESLAKLCCPKPLTHSMVSKN
jgi:hypothetical protein